MAAKRKHATLSLTTKMEILQKIDSGVSQKVLADEYNVGRSTIYDILKKRRWIEHYVNVAAADLQTSSRQTLKAGKYRRMEDTLYAWFLEERSTRTLSVDNIKQKALELHDTFYNDTGFKASDGWFLRFKTRYGIHSLKKEENNSEMVEDKNFATPFLEPQESGKFTALSEEIDSDPSQSCEVIWLEGESSKRAVKSENALAAVKLSLRWAEENNEDEEVLQMLSKLKDKINKKLEMKEAESKSLVDQT